jgi:hypothetical protein
LYLDVDVDVDVDVDEDDDDDTRDCTIEEATVKVRKLRYS